MVDLERRPFMRKRYCLFSAVLFVLILCACTNHENLPTSVTDNSALNSSSQSTELSQSSESLPTDFSAEYARIIKGYSLMDIGLEVDTSKTFQDPNCNADGLWGAEHTAISEYWNNGEFYGNATRIHVDTSERVVDFEPQVMYLLQCFQKDELVDGAYVFLKEQAVPTEEIRETCLLEKDGYLICDVTRFLYPDKSFEERIQEREKTFPDYDFRWALSVYDYVSEKLSNLIVPA